MAAKKKASTARSMSADTYEAKGNVALAKLGRYLSARDVSGSADVRTDVSKKRTTQMLREYRSGGGSPTPAKKKNSSKSSPKMSHEQREKSFRKNAPQGAKPKKK